MPEKPDIVAGHVSPAGKPKVILLGSDSMGRGDEQLGRLLMANFLRLLGEGGKDVETICLVNSGVRLSLQDSMCLGHMKKLEAAGMAILICRTCLEYLDIEEQVAVGRISGMAEIQGKLLMGDVVAL